jgi:hypothetical protein
MIYVRIWAHTLCMSEIEHTTSKSKIEHTNDLCQKLSTQIIDVIIWAHKCFTSEIEQIWETSICLPVIAIPYIHSFI